MTCSVMSLCAKFLAPSVLVYQKSGLLVSIWIHDTQHSFAWAENWSCLIFTLFIGQPTLQVWLNFFLLILAVFSHLPSISADSVQRFKRKALIKPLPQKAWGVCSQESQLSCSVLEPTQLKTTSTTLVRQTCLFDKIPYYVADPSSPKINFV